MAGVLDLVGLLLPLKSIRQALDIHLLHRHHGNSDSDPLILIALPQIFDELLGHNLVIINTHPSFPVFHARKTYLPADSKLISQPPTNPLLLWASLTELIPVIVDLSLVLALDLERDRLVELEERAAVEADERVALEVESDGEHGAGLVFVDLFAAAIVELRLRDG